MTFVHDKVMSEARVGHIGTLLDEGEGDGKGCLLVNRLLIGCARSDSDWEHRLTATMCFLGGDCRLRASGSPEGLVLEVKVWQEDAKYDLDRP